MDPFSVYAYADKPAATDFGDAFSAGLLPPSATATVAAQPTNGVVTVQPDGSGWRMETPALPGVSGGTITDSWQWAATAGGAVVAGPFVVPVEIYNAG